MKSEKWNPTPFAAVLRMPPCPAKRHAYEAQEILSGDESPKISKIIREWEIFVRFSQAVELEIDPAEVEMLDPNFSSPPPPDLRCPVAGEMHYFELGEVIQEDLARASTARTRRRVLEPRIPLTKVWTPLEDIVTKKLRKAYNPAAKPLSLLLYYERDSPFWDFLQPLIQRRDAEIRTLFQASVFDFMWLFD